MPTAARRSCRILLIHWEPGVIITRTGSRLWLTVGRNWPRNSTPLRRKKKAKKSARLSQRAGNKYRVLAFILSGQGRQWWGMGRELMKHEPVFREAIENCDAAPPPVGQVLASRRNSAAPKKHPRCNGRRLDSRPFCHANGARGALEILGCSAFSHRRP